MDVCALRIGSAVRTDHQSGTVIIDTQKIGEDRPVSQVVQGILQILLYDFRRIVACCVEDARETAHRSVRLFADRRERYRLPWLQAGARRRQDEDSDDAMKLKSCLPVCSMLSWLCRTSSATVASSDDCLNCDTRTLGTERRRER